MTKNLQENNMKWIDENGEFAPEVIRLDGMQVINPREEHYRAAGYMPYVEPLPTEDKVLEKAIEEKVGEIKAYDSSDAINSFTLNGLSVWINREDRLGTTRAVELDIARGLTESDIWLHGFHLRVNCQLALKLLAAVETYAFDAFNKTQEHIYNVRQLKTVSEVEAYDYRTGYPEKLNLKTT